jgi:hypothetical protein
MNPQLTIILIYNQKLDYPIKYFFNLLNLHEFQLSGSQKTSTVSSNVLTVQSSFDPSTEWTLKINTTDFGNTMPYHLIVDQECKLVNFGSGLKLVLNRLILNLSYFTFY